jgi:hypothetical protein
VRAVVTIPQRQRIATAIGGNDWIKRIEIMSAFQRNRLSPTEIGQIAALIRDIKPAGEVVKEVWTEFVEAKKKLLENFPA